MDYTIDQLIVSDEQTDKRIRDGIEKNRKGNFTLDVKNAKNVHVKLKNHKFRFGCNMFMLDEFPDDANKNEIYKQKLKDCFNLLTVPFYWDATEPEEGKTRYSADSEKIYRRPPADLCVKFCEENGIEPREHALCYGNFFPDWLRGKSDEQVKAHIIERMRQISERYADKIPTIEVTNEMFWERSKTDFYKNPEYMEFCFKQAEKYFPGNTLCINEWSGEIWDNGSMPWNGYYMQIENLLLKGARVDAIGMQYHMFYRENEYYDRTRKFYDLSNCLKVLDCYSRFQKDIQITEITIPAYTAAEEDENLQADVIEKLYSMWFSHPSVTQIVYWNLVDGYAAFTTPGDMKGGENYYRGGLLRFDMSEKPAYKRLKHLIKEVWTTDETLCANENGEVSFRGFYGEYEVTVGGKTYTVNFDRNGKEEIL